MLAWVTGQIQDSPCQKLEFVLEENRVYRETWTPFEP